MSWYWLTASDGSNARLGADANSSETAAIARSVKARLMSIFPSATDPERRAVPGRSRECDLTLLGCVR